MAVSRQDAGQYQAAVWQATVASQARTVIGVSWEMGWLSSEACLPALLHLAWALTGEGKAASFLLCPTSLSSSPSAFNACSQVARFFLSLCRRFMQCLLSILSCYHLPLLLLLQTPVTESTTPFMKITQRLFSVVIIHSLLKSDGWLLIFMIS